MVTIIISEDAMNCVLYGNPCLRDQAVSSSRKFLIPKMKLETPKINFIWVKLIFQGSS